MVPCPWPPRRCLTQITGYGHTSATHKALASSVAYCCAAAHRIRSDLDSFPTSKPSMKRDCTVCGTYGRALLPTRSSVLQAVDSSTVDHSSSGCIIASRNGVLHTANASGDSLKVFPTSRSGVLILRLIRGEANFSSVCLKLLDS